MINEVINTFVGDAAYTGFGEQPPRKKIFEWHTDIKRTDTRKEQRNQILEEPVRHFFLNWNFMDAAARNKLIELVHRAKGRYDTFLFKDNLDYACTVADCIITAVGGETTTQLIKTYYPGETETWDENRTKIVPDSQTVYLDVGAGAVEQTEGVNYSLVDTTGILTWIAPAALGAGDIVTALYEFYFEVRFNIDAWEDVESYNDFFSANGIELLEVK